MSTHNSKNAWRDSHATSLSRRVLPLSIVMACTFSCSSNSQENERAYTIPNPLCGVELDTALYRPIYPPGEEADVTNYYHEYENGELDPTGECVVEVDEAQAIYIETRAETNPGINNFLSSYRDEAGRSGSYRVEDAEQVADGPRETWVWPDLAVTSVACGSSSIDLETVNVSIRLDWVGEEDYSDPLQELIEPFAAEQLRRIGERTCDPA
jgi:hypothetical protein